MFASAEPIPVDPGLSERLFQSDRREGCAGLFIPLMVLMQGNQYAGYR